MRRDIEILSPAGSYECLKAAIAAGADAVYLGGSRFGARAFADNFTEEELLEAIDYVHLHGKKVYLTVNTLLKEEELKKQFYDYLLPYYERGIDAVIVQDIGVLHFVKRHFPLLPIHASTQMTITNLLGARMLQELGVERVVTSRELQLDEIREIAENTSLEIESFVHGALCYSYSGQCLYSSLIGGRSGNRGQCAQPCRLPYCVGKEKKERYVFSLKDICTLDIIPELVESGIHSFKIEGRMKKPEYVALVTAMYRKYVDLYFEKGKEGYRVSEEDKKALLDLYNRGGFHTGYYQTRNGRKMVSITRPNHAGVEAVRITKYNGRQITGKALTNLSKGDIIELPEPKENYTISQAIQKGETVSLLSLKKQNLSNTPVLNRVRNEQLIVDVRKHIIEKNVKHNITGNIFLNEGERIRFLVQDGLHFVEVQGEVCQSAINQPTSEERIKSQLFKTGNTAFAFTELNVFMNGNLFIPMQELNELRRKALAELEQQILSGYRRNAIVLEQDEERMPEVSGSLTTKISVLVKNKEQFAEVCHCDFVKRIYVDCNYMSRIWENMQCKEIIRQVRELKKEIFLAMPHVFRKKTRDMFAASDILSLGWDGLLIRNYESYQFLKEMSYNGMIIADHHLYTFNNAAKGFWRSHQIATTAPYELNEKELQTLDIRDSELVIYGYQPMMVSAQCVLATTEGCLRKPSCLMMQDRYHNTFSVCNYCDYCYNIVYNTLPLALFDCEENIRHLKPASVRLEFSLENAKQTREVLTCYIDGKEPHFPFTRGHFKRGVK